jgi:arginyl-tRNA synthetase
MPLLVQKTDGGFMYATTDLAAVNALASSASSARVSIVVSGMSAGRADLLHVHLPFQTCRKRSM